jgi:hypothetical protein
LYRRILANVEALVYRQDDLPQDKRPVVVSFGYLNEPVMTLLLTPDSSGKVGCFLSFADYADKSQCVLTLATVPALLLGQRIERHPSWDILTKFALMLRDEAFYLRDGTPYNGKGG